MPVAVGIDLGTTNSVVAVVQGGEPEVLLNAEGNRLTPSIVAFSKTGERLVGELAKRQAVLNPDRTIRSIKRKMGSRDKTSVDGKDYSPEADFGDDSVQTQSRRRNASGTDSSATWLLRCPRISTTASARPPKTPVKSPVSTCCASSTSRRQRPSLMVWIAASKDETIVVYDLGGGTFDVSILEVSEGLLEVKSTAGDTRLGGDDFDERLVNYIADTFKGENGIDLRKDTQALQRLKDAAEKAKIELSSATQTNVNLPFITMDTQSGPKHLVMDITRAKFQELTHDLFERTRKPIERALSDAGLKAGRH